MKSKKLLSIIMTLSMTFSIGLSSLNVQAIPVVPTTQYEVGEVRYLSPPNIEKVIEMLKKEGKIPQNATPQETNKIVNEYLRKTDPARRMKPSKKEYKKTKKMIQNMKSKGLVHDENYKMIKAEEEPDYVQPEGKWKGDIKEVRPLVVLMEYQDYKFTSITAEETAFYFDNYDKKHYKDILFAKDKYKGPKDANGNREEFYTMKGWYKDQSGGSLIVNGEVVGPYTARENAEYYGGDQGEDKDLNARELVKEAFTAVVENNVDLSKYDTDGDKIIDQFLVVHASVGQEAGGGKLGPNAIWSHKSEFTEPFRVEGSEYGIGVYNVNPQDGAPGVFCHEFGHALGLPDEYDTIYSGLGEPVGYWSIMSSGSWTGKIGGTQASGFSPWCKKFLQANHGGNWQKGKEINLKDIDEKGMDFLIDEASTKGTNLDVLQINLPEKMKEIAKPRSGENVYFSGRESMMDSSMETSIDLKSAKNPKLTFKTWYDIEEGWDFATVEVKISGEDWTAIPDENGITIPEASPNVVLKDVINGITGSSNGWIDAKFDLSEYAGKEIGLRFRYRTDPASDLEGFYIDDINVVEGEKSIFSDDAEGETRFNFNEKFQKSDGYKHGNQYYLIEWRNHTGTDAGLANVRGNGLSYDPGMVVWYCDDTYDNNWVGVHPGEGFDGVVDADQKILFWTNNEGIPTYYPDGSFVIHDSAFGIKRTSEIDTKNLLRGNLIDDETFMHPYFDDNRTYVIDNAGYYNHYGRRVPKFGLRIYVTGESKDRTVGKIHVCREEIEVLNEIENSEQAVEAVEFEEAVEAAKSQQAVEKVEIED